MPRPSRKGRQVADLRTYVRNLRGKMRRGCVPPTAVFPASLFYEVVGGERASGVTGG